MIDTGQYIVTETHTFGIQDFPEVEQEIIRIREKTSRMPSPYKADIIISFLKDHMIKSEWVLADPELVALITSSQAGTKNLERLFASSQKNIPFLFGLENYIRKILLSP
ncbi:hypothetical protein SAMN04488109_5970 [Chryseolinea serpens]|uniref:Uncharacterized protein n=1 Tax=Chryseolinea serpens TaxID=947013 RepID=A0A1M5WSS6_9BACT|nr:hypothetical protein [Chryseolinea serpens]SHH90472.1 hypothetical protein SAMN04488109_5970 [Chryseolinea serpens]